MFWNFEDYFIMHGGGSIFASWGSFHFCTSSLLKCELSVFVLYAYDKISEQSRVSVRDENDTQKKNCFYQCFLQGDN